MKLSIPDRPKRYVIGCTSDGRTAYSWVIVKDGGRVEISSEYDKASVFDTQPLAEKFLTEIGLPVGMMVMAR